jgi:hypothetical protein
LAPSSITFGSFADPVFLDNNGITQRIFYNINFARCFCDSLPKETLEQLEDLRQAGYQSPEIMHVLSLPFLPPKEIVLESLGKCSQCSGSDHLRINCPWTSNGHDSAVNGPLSIVSSDSLSGPLRVCFNCLELGHLRKDCQNETKCLGCYGLGHKFGKIVRMKQSV